MTNHEDRHSVRPHAYPHASELSSCVAALPA
jgi:hypothetical protein